MLSFSGVTFVLFLFGFRLFFVFIKAAAIRSIVPRYAIKYMDAATDIWMAPVSKHHIQSEYGDEQADAGRDCRTRLARPNSMARTGTGKYSLSLFS